MFTAKVKVVDAKASPITTGSEFYDLFFGVVDPTDQWLLALDEFGVRWYDGSTVTTIATMDTTDAYHTYAITYDPDADSGGGAVTIAIDGIEVTGSERTRAQARDDTTENTIVFGDNSATALGYSSISRWSLVRFEAPPPPPHGTIIRFR